MEALTDAQVRYARRMGIEGSLFGPRLLLQPLF